MSSASLKSSRDVVGEGVLERLRRSERDAVDQDVQAPQASSTASKTRSRSASRGHVRGQHQLAARRGGQVAHALLQTLALKGEGQLGALTGKGLSDGPGNAAAIGDAENQPAAASRAAARWQEYYFDSASPARRITSESVMPWTSSVNSTTPNAIAISSWRSAIVGWQRQRQRDRQRAAQAAPDQHRALAVRGHHSHAARQPQQLGWHDDHQHAREQHAAMLTSTGPAAAASVARLCVKPTSKNTTRVGQEAEVLPQVVEQRAACARTCPTSRP